MCRRVRVVGGVARRTAGVVGDIDRRHGIGARHIAARQTVIEIVAHVAPGESGAARVLTVVLLSEVRTVAVGTGGLRRVHECRVVQRVDRAVDGVAALAGAQARSDRILDVRALLLVMTGTTGERSARVVEPRGHDPPAVVQTHMLVHEVRRVTADTVPRGGGACRSGVVRVVGDTARARQRRDRRMGITMAAEGADRAVASATGGVTGRDRILDSGPDAVMAAEAAERGVALLVHGHQPGCHRVAPLTGAAGRGRAVSGLIVVVVESEVADRAVSCGRLADDAGVTHRARGPARDLVLRIHVDRRQLAADVAVEAEEVGVGHRV